MINLCDFVAGPMSLNAFLIGPRVHFRHPRAERYELFVGSDHDGFFKDNETGDYFDFSNKEEMKRIALQLEINA